MNPILEALESNRAVFENPARDLSARGGESQAFIQKDELSLPYTIRQDPGAYYSLQDQGADHEAERGDEAFSLDAHVISAATEPDAPGGIVYPEPDAQPERDASEADPIGRLITFLEREDRLSPQKMR